MNFYLFFKKSLLKCQAYYGLLCSACVFIMFCTSSASSQTNPQKTITMPSGNVLHVEIAKDVAERALGLMYRKSLQRHRGMLFVFRDEAVRAFWMKDTLIPLSIAFINKQGIVVKIADMQPLSVEPVSSDAPCQYALEVNKGAFANYQLVEGSKLTLPPVVARE